ncbi:dipeptidase PepE [Galbibacter sp. BG1]
MKNLLIASTSTVHGSSYLEYILDDLAEFFKASEEIIFIPYARPGGISHDDYTAIAQKGFDAIGKQVTGIHTFSDPIEALKNAKAVFTGGGNTFLLVSQLYKLDVMPTLRARIFEGMHYFGTSAGANITGLTMQTTNDMPIVYPPSFKTLGAIPFNINPHYLDPDPSSTHKGETRETRIKEFHSINTQPVIGLREGSWLEVKNDRIILRGNLQARVFEQNKPPYEIESGSEVRF